ncbi:MAG: hypothetical protein ACK5M3_04065 [Dysgonomonas sp.]
MSSFFKSKLLPVFVGTWILLAIFAFLVIFKKMGGNRIAIFAPSYKEYPLLDQYENIYKPFFGIVKEMETYSGVSYITLNNGAKFSIDDRTQNFECEPSKLSAFIEIGDSIAKPGEDFLFFVHRKKTCYPFKIKERLRALPVDMSKRQKAQ